MNKKYIIIIILIIIASLGAYYYYNYNGVSVKNVALVGKTSESNPTPYELNYTLDLKKTYKVLDCQYALISENGTFIGYGSKKIENTKDVPIFIGKEFKINSLCTMNRNNKGEYNKFITNPELGTYDLNNHDEFPVPKKVQIRIYAEKFDPNKKNPNGTFSQKPIYSEVFDVKSG